MKKYTITRYLVAQETIEVLADNEQDAIAEANGRDLPTSLFNVTLVPSEDTPDIVAEEEVEEDLDTLFQRANEIVERQENINTYSNIFIPVTITETSGGRAVGEHEEYEQVDYYYWDYGETTVVTTEEHEVSLSCLPDDACLAVCRDIIDHEDEDDDDEPESQD